MGYATAKRAFSFQDFDRAHTVGPSHTAEFWEAYTKRQSFRESEVRGATHGISKRLDEVLSIVARMRVIKGQPSIAVLVNELVAISNWPPLSKGRIEWDNIMIDDLQLSPLCKLAKPVATLTYFANIMYLFQVCIFNHCYVNNVSRMTNWFVFTDGPRFYLGNFLLSNTDRQMHKWASASTTGFLY